MFNSKAVPTPPPDSSTLLNPKPRFISESKSTMGHTTEADSEKPTVVAAETPEKPITASSNDETTQYKSVLDFNEDDMNDPVLATLAFQLAKKTIKEQRMQIKRLSNRNRNSREQQEPLKRIIKSVAKCKGISLDEISRYI